MPKTRTVKPYRWLAQYYDRLFETAPAVQLDAAREQILKTILPGVGGAVCDLACGTGRTAMRLARGGAKVYAVDLSPAMCRLARRNARAASLRIRVIQADMRSFELPEAVDLITCECDAINHVPYASDLSLVAKAAARALRAGGHLFFDVNNALAFEKLWTGDVWIELPGVVGVMRNGHNRECTKAWSEVEWFIREGRDWRRHRERVEEVCWTDRAIRRALKEAGFDRVRSWDEAPFWSASQPLPPGARTIYLARKAPPRGLLK